MLFEVKTVEEMAGRGLKGSLVIEKQEETYLIGNLTLMKEYHIVLEKEAEKQLRSLKHQAEQNRKMAEKEVQKLKKRIKLRNSGRN